MSSVGSSDSNSRAAENESVRRKYEDFRQKESELIKKHQKEIRRINEQHYTEVERLKQEHQSQMGQMQKGSHDAISARDHKYQQEMDDLRGIHRKQLQNVAEDNQRREEAMRKAVTSDNTAQKQNNEERFQKLTDDYAANLRRQEESYRSNMEEGREEQQAAIRANHDRLTRAHENESKALRDDRDNSVRGLQRQYEDYRDNVSKEKKAHEIRDLQDKNRTSDNLMHAVSKERNARTDSEQILRDGFTDGLQKMRERYDKSMKTEIEANRMSEEGFQSGIVNRIDNQVRRLEGENTGLKEANTRQQLMMKSNMQRELRNYRDSYQKNLENYKDQRDEAVRQSNEMNHKDVAKVRGELENQIVEANRFYRGRMEEQNQIFRTAYDRLKGDFEARNGQTKQTTDERVKHIVDVTENEKQRLIELNKENHTASQRMKADQMRALRDQLDDDKQQTVNRLQEQMRKMELQHTDRMNLMVGKYEKQIQGLNDQLVRERRMNDENMKRMTEELARVHKLEVDQVESKNREKVRQLGAQHSDELRQVNKRHEEKLDQVIGEIKRT